MNGLSTKEYLNIFPLGSYDFLIGMDWLDPHHTILDCHNKAFDWMRKEIREQSKEFPGQLLSEKSQQYS
jgi:hypothetical protein